MNMTDEYNEDLPLPEAIDQDALNKFMESCPDINFRIRTALVWPRHPEVWIDLSNDANYYQKDIMCIIMRRVISYDVLASVTDPTAYILEVLKKAVLELREEEAKEVITSD